MSSTKQPRGHSLKLYKHSVRLDIRKNCEWNLLPDELLDCTTVNNFKKKTRSSPLAQQGIQISRIASFPVYYIVFVHLDGDLKFKFKFNGPNNIANSNCAECWKVIYVKCVFAERIHRCQLLSECIDPANN